ncbi:MAG: ubiquitin-like small modifier protein 1 [Acidimicrobiia bacterium]
MSVEVRIPTMLRTHTEGQALVRVEGATVSEVIGALVQQFPGLESNLLAPEGGLHRFVNIYVNDEDIRYLDGLATPVDDGSELTVLPAVAGG